MEGKEARSRYSRMATSCEQDCAFGYSYVIASPRKANAGFAPRRVTKNYQPGVAPVIQGSQAASQAWNWSGVMPSSSRRPLASAPSGTRANCAGRPSATRYLPHRQDVDT